MSLSGYRDRIYGPDFFSGAEGLKEWPQLFENSNSGKNQATFLDNLKKGGKEVLDLAHDYWMDMLEWAVYSIRD